MDFTQEQISTILDGIANSENGFENLMKHTSVINIDSTDWFSKVKSAACE